MKRLYRQNLPEAISKTAKETDAPIVRKRQRLNLPAAQVSDAELEDIVKLTAGGGAGNTGLLGCVAQ